MQHLTHLRERVCYLGIFVVALCGCQLTPPFKWDSTYASDGVSLEIKEERRMPLEGGTAVVYTFQTLGFAPGERVYIWVKQLAGTYVRPTGTITDVGLVLAAGVDEPTHIVRALVRGQPFDVAIQSRDGTKRAQAKVFPFPIRAVGTGGCSAEVELLTRDGYLFVIEVRGFHADEEVETTSRFKDETNTGTASLPNGQLAQITVFGPGDNGMASLTVRGKTGSVTVEYGVGRNALEIQ